jgi:hypothetical protein
LPWQTFLTMAGYWGPHFCHPPLSLAPSDAQYLYPRYLRVKKPLIAVIFGASKIFVSENR